MKRYYHLIGIIILGIIFTKVDFQQIISQFSRLNIMLFLFINLLILPSMFLKSCRWRYLLRLQGIDYSAGSSFMAYLGGIFCGIITPGRIGEMTKALYLKEDKDIPLAEGVAGIFVDRLFDLYILTLLGGIGGFYFLTPEKAEYRIFIFLAVLFILLIPLLLFNKTILEKIVRAAYKTLMRRLDKGVFNGQFKDFLCAVKKIIAGPIYFPFILSAGAYLIYFYQCYLLANLAYIDISLMILASIVAISTLASLLPITILGIGTREASLIYLFSLVGLSAESAVVYSFLLFLSFYVCTGFLAYIGWLVKGRAN